MGQYCVCSLLATECCKNCSGETKYTKLLGKCCHLVDHFKHSALATDALGKRQKALGFKRPLHVIQEVATIWNSTLHVVQRLVVLKQPIFILKTQ